MITARCADRPFYTTGGKALHINFIVTLRGKNIICMCYNTSNKLPVKKVLVLQESVDLDCVSLFAQETQVDLQ
jgi:hypothetical protein